MAETVAASATPSDRTLKCVVVTPEPPVLDEPADFVAIPMYDGELGVLPSRAPLIGRLGYGELRIRRGSETKRFFVDGGFCQIRANVVTVLTQRAMLAEEIDQAAAERILASPSPMQTTPEGRAAHQKSQARARAQLRVARRLQGASH